MTQAVKNVVVRAATDDDLVPISKLNAQVFTGNRDNPDAALRWITCLYRSYPRYMLFVCLVDGQFAGYIGWEIHGGFKRATPVLELEQVGFDSAYQGNGYFHDLYERSLDAATAVLCAENSRIESHVTVIVWAYSLNLNAIKAYSKEFHDGVVGMRIMHGDRAESMLRTRRAVTRPVRG